jgi:uncharacterized membrane protein required for colicin V production
MGSLIVRFLAACLSALLKRFKLERFDRLAGGLLGVSKGVVIGAVLMVIGARFPTAGVKEPLETSVSGRYVVLLTDWVMEWVEESKVKERAKNARDDLMKKASSLGDEGRKLAKEYQEKRLREEAERLMEKTELPGSSGEAEPE